MRLAAPYYYGPGSYYGPAYYPGPMPMTASPYITDRAIPGSIFYPF